MKLYDTIGLLDKRIFDAREKNAIGLANGKMGCCIYFYYMGRITGNQEYTQMAGLLIDEVFACIDDIALFDIKNGLSGIGLSIHFLINNQFVKGDSNEILKDVDNLLFKQLCDSDKFDKEDLLLQLQLLYYFNVRYEKQKKNSENEYLFKEIIINTVNNLAEKIHLFFSEEPFSFHLENPLILFLLTLNQCYDVYKEKTVKILNEISFDLLSKIPYVHANKLYLLYAMNRINRQVEMEHWGNHIRLLAKETNIEHIIDHELAVNISFSNGLTAIFMLFLDLTDLFSQKQVAKHKKKIINKIEHNPVWRKLFNDEDYLKQNSGLFSGYLGASMLLQKFRNDENRFN